MQPVVRARVVAAQRLEDHERLPQLDRVVDRPLQPEVPAEPPGRDHPVEDVVTSGMDRALIHGTDTGARGRQRGEALIT